MGENGVVSKRCEQIARELLVIRCWLMAESEPDWRYWEIERWQLNASALNRSKIV
jgi:hypothetical protein